MNKKEYILDQVMKEVGKKKKKTEIREMRRKENTLPLENNFLLNYVLIQWVIRLLLKKETSDN